jgi:nitrate/nitrite transport system substrate-binding protein
MNDALEHQATTPEKTDIKVGFIPLTDCAPVVMASVLGLDAKYGIRIVLSREASWAAIRDKLVMGELDAAHVLYGLVYGLHLGIGGPETDMAVLMTLNQNGQGITLSRQLADRGVTDGESLAALMLAEPGDYGFAQTFPTGTHAMWLYYWLAAHGIHPLRDARVITVPPPRMVETMEQGRIVGCCVGEPWNQQAIAAGVGFSVATSQEIWKDHPEKVLGTTAEWVAAHPAAARALTAAVLEACRWLDESDANRRLAAQVLAGPDYVDADMKVILPRMLGHFEDGLGHTRVDPATMRFFGGGEVTFPWLSDGMWFLTQQRRWGLIKDEPDYLSVARAVNRLDVYRDAATLAGVPLPEGEMRTSTLMDGSVWDGMDPSGYAHSFALHALHQRIPNSSSNLQHSARYAS